MTEMTIANAVQVRVVYDQGETVIPLADLVPENEPLNYYDSVVTNVARRNELLAAAGNYLLRPGLFASYTVSIPPSGGLLISPKAVFGA